MRKSTSGSGIPAGSSRAESVETTAHGSSGGDVDERLFVASVEKAMKVLETFSREAPSLSMSDIALRTGVGRSAAQRFVYTLEHLEYLRRDPITRQYSLSPKVFRFAQNALSANTALERASRVLSQLGAATRETISWVELDGDDIIILGNVPSSQLSSINLSVGMRFPALTSSSGQVLLAHFEPGRVTEMFERASPAVRRRLGLANSREMSEMIEQVRTVGFSMTEKDMDQGSLSISVPVFDYSRRAIAAINLSTLKTRFGDLSAQETLLPQMLEASREASRAIGF